MTEHNKTNQEDDETIINDFLRAQLAVLLLNELTFLNTTLEFQAALEKRFGTKYDPDRINDELDVLALENEVMEEMSMRDNGKSSVDYTHMFPEDF